MSRLPPETLFHVELRIESRLLLQARPPEAPHPDVMTHWTEADFEKEVIRCDRATGARQQLDRDYIRHAVSCILGCEKLNELLAQCGDMAIIRISLEHPQVQADAHPAAA